MTSSTLPGRRPDGHPSRPESSASTHRGASLGGRLHEVDESLLAAFDRATVLARRFGPTLLRYSLALVFCWFGALKVVGRSPVHDLLGATLPWFSADLVVPAIGVVEMVLGIGLLIPRARSLVILILVGHLCGTFLTFVMAPTWMFRGGDPLMLTASGEFVLKNLVLISAVLILLGACERTPRGDLDVADRNVLAGRPSADVE